MIRVLAMLLTGFLGWRLALSRALALDRGDIGRLCVLIFFADLLGVMEAVYLSREGTWMDAIVGGIACAAGGGLAAWTLRKQIKAKNAGK